VTPNGAFHLVADIRDLEIVDCDGEICGIVDDIELDGQAGGPLALTALLVGPGAYRDRLPKFVLPLVHFIAGNRMTRIPWSEVRRITSVVTLASTAKQLGLTKSEAKAARMLPSMGGKDASL
jgi:sporulation protein YlmC with PRC-barrel domain